MHGYAITAHIQRASAELLRVEEGSLYPALHRMEQDGWLRAEWGTTEKNRQARFYTLTATGKKQLAARGGELGPPARGRHARPPLRLIASRRRRPCHGIARIRNVFRSTGTPATSSARWSSISPSARDELVAGGMSRDDARREARRRFGNYGVQQENARATRRLHLARVVRRRRALRAARACAQPRIRARRDSLARARHRRQHRDLQPHQRRAAAKRCRSSHPEELVEVTLARQDATSFTNPIWEQLRDRQDIVHRRVRLRRAEFNLADGRRGAARRGRLGQRRLLLDPRRRPASGGSCSRATTFAAARRSPCSATGSGRASSAARRARSARRRLDGHRFQIVGVADAAFFGMEVGQPIQLYVPLCPSRCCAATSALDRRSNWYLHDRGPPKPG